MAMVYAYQLRSRGWLYDATRGYRDGVVERYRDALLDHTGADPSARFLELGIGSGLIAQAFLRAAHDYYGIDLSLVMMRLICEKLEDDRRPLLAQADCAHLPFAAASFDLVHAVRVFHHLADWRDCIDEARRLLRAGGALVIVENLRRRRPSRRPGQSCKRNGTRSCAAWASATTAFTMASGLLMR